MKVFYDLHIHSDLSPCGDKDMTPNNISNMAYIKGLDVIAVTDHNSCKNYQSVNKVAKKLGIKVIPAMEINTHEEVHVLSYFLNYKDAHAVEEIIYDSLPNIKNKTSIFGEQNIYDEDDHIIGSVDKLLLSASKYTLSEIYRIVVDNNGIIIPAHVNKTYYGILGVLGFFPEDINFDFVEVPENAVLSHRFYTFVSKYKKIINSDAHYLENISEPKNFFDLDSVDEIYSFLKLIK